MIKKYLEQFTQPIFPFLATGFTNKVLLDAVGPSSTAAGGSGPPASPLTFSHTCSGANFLLVGVSIGTVGVNTLYTVNSVTYAGQSMTLVPGSFICTSPANFAGTLALYYLLNPPAGANSVSIAFTDTNPSGGGETILAGSLSFKNVSQTTPFSNVTINGGGTEFSSITIPSKINNMVVDVIMNGSAINSSYTSLAWLKNISNINFGSNIAASTSVGYPTTTMSYSLVSDTWTTVALSLNAA